jgi:hypothetical protein
MQIQLDVCKQRKSGKFSVVSVPERVEADNSRFRASFQVVRADGGFHFSLDPVDKKLQNMIYFEVQFVKLSPGRYEKRLLNSFSISCSSLTFSVDICGISNC